MKYGGIVLNAKGRYIIWMLGGGYVVYLGGRIFLDAWRERPDNYTFFMLAGVVFVIVGGLLALNGVKEWLKQDRSDGEVLEKEQSTSEQNVSEQDISEQGTFEQKSEVDESEKLEDSQCEQE